MKVTKYTGKFFDPGDTFESLKASALRILVDLGCDARTLRYGHCETDPERGVRHIWLADKP